MVILLPETKDLSAILFSSMDSRFETEGVIGETAILDSVVSVVISSKTLTFPSPEISIVSESSVNWANAGCASEAIWSGS